VRAEALPRIGLPAEPLVDGPTTLRRWRDEDAHALVELCQDREIVRWIRVSAGYGMQDAHAYLATREESARAGLAAHFAIAAAASGPPIGSISLLRFAWPHRRAEVGYWLGAAARGHGHATRAVAIICHWGFRALGLERIDLLASTGNPASQGVAQRAGFTREAVLRSYLNGADGRQDMVCFGLLAGDDSARLAPAPMAPSQPRPGSA
jgi:RimJ/RimL family protein N-acetyltransferase